MEIREASLPRLAKCNPQRQRNHIHSITFLFLSIHMIQTITISISCLSQKTPFIDNSGRLWHYGAERPMPLVLKCSFYKGWADLMLPWKQHDSTPSDLLTCSIWITLFYTFLRAAVVTNWTRKRLPVHLWHNDFIVDK